MDNIISVIEKVKREAKENLVPIVRDKTLETLISICKEHSVNKVLEIGTATGYSGLNLLTVAKSLTTIEKNIERYEQANKNFKDARVSSFVSQLLGDAGEILCSLNEKGEKFDLVFLDGPKGQYVKYLPSIKSLLKSGGVLFADNILLGGLIKDQTRVNHKNRTMFNNMKAFLSNIQECQEFKTNIYEIEDGFSISIKQ